MPAVRDFGRSFDKEDREPAGCREEDPDPPADAGHQPGSGHRWVDAAADGPPMPPRHSGSAPLPPRGPSAMPPPRRGESMHSPGGTAAILLREVMGDPCRDDLRQTTGRGKRLHQSWNLGWRRFKA